MTCGIGGDCQCLFYKESDKTVYAINGSGRNGEKATLDKILSAGVTCTTESKFTNHGLWVTVPGCIAGLYSIIKHFGSGKLSMNEILEPTIKLAEEGVPMPYKGALLFEKRKDDLKNLKNAEDVLTGPGAPVAGELYFVPKLAKSLREIAKFGPEVFYSGHIAQNIVEAVHNAGGFLTLNDMKAHLASSSTSLPIEPVFVDFQSFRVWEMKPNTTGLVVLVGLNILNLFDLKNLEHNSAEYIHIVVEATKYAYLECWDYLCDPEFCTKSVDELLSIKTARRLKNCINSEKALKSNMLVSGGNTSYTAVVDEEGNGCSFIFSVSSHFGSGIIPDDCGFVLHDRGKCMNLKPGSSNAYGPGKYPLHTIIPAMVTDPKTNDLLAVFGVIGRWMQPQGHIQVLLNMVIFGMNPQMALNQPRFMIGNPMKYTEYMDSFNTLYLEKGICPSVSPVLREKGHEHCEMASEHNRAIFGRGHIIAQPILWNPDAIESQKSWWGAADPRSDGCSMGL